MGAKASQQTQTLRNENYTPGVIRTFSIFYPNSRVPIVPFHFGMHAIHISQRYLTLDLNDNHTVENSEANDSFLPKHGNIPNTWFYYCKQEIDHDKKLSGTAIIALWQLKNNNSTDISPLMAYKYRQYWEHLIYHKVRKHGLSMEQTQDFLVSTFFSPAASGCESECALHQHYEGMFIISDHPGKAVCAIVDNTQ